MSYAHVEAAYKITHKAVEGNGRTKGSSVWVQRSVLVALAFRASNDTGECWSSTRALTRETLWSRPAVMRALAALEDQGHIEIVRRPGRASVYRVLGGNPGQLSGNPKGYNRGNPRETTTGNPRGYPNVSERKRTHVTAPTGATTANASVRPGAFDPGPGETLGEVFGIEE